MCIDTKVDTLVCGHPFYDLPKLATDEDLKTLNLDKGSTTLVKNFSDLNVNWEEKNNKYSMGGSGHMIAIALAHLGQDIAFHGAIGNDVFSEKILKRHKELGITSYFSRKEDGTGIVNCFITPDAQRTLQTYLGASKNFSPKDVQEKLFEHAKHVHVEGYLAYNDGVIQKCIELAKKNDAQVSVDLACKAVVSIIKSNEKLRSSILKADLIFGNVEEMLALTGKKTAKEAVESFPLETTVVATNGADPCVIKKSGESQGIFYPVIKVDKVIDTTGAGDAYLAGFLYGVSQRRTRRRC